MAAKRNRASTDEAASNLSIWQEALVGVEVLMLHASPAYYGMGIPRGDGSAILLIPGFLVSDIYLLEIFAWLRRIGYQPYFSGIGINKECPNLLIERVLNQTLDRAIKETRGKVHIVGHSLGGIIARSLAGKRPNDVASVTTLGAPLRGRAVHPKLFEMIEIVRRQILDNNGASVLPSCYTGRCTCSFLDSLRRDLPPSVLETAIYTKNDGLVDWRYCITGKEENDFEVAGTHVGLAFNPIAYSIMAERLASCST